MRLSKMGRGAVGGAGSASVVGGGSGPVPPPPIVFAGKTLIVIGQSNAEKGILLVNTDLPASYKHAYSNILYYGADGLFRPMDYTVQASYQSPMLVGTENFSLQFPLYPLVSQAVNEIICICSVSVGDTSLAAVGAEWRPTAVVGALYTSIVSRINALKVSMNSNYGFPPNFIGVIWDQSEKDARILVNSNAYQAAEAALIANIDTACSENLFWFVNKLNPSVGNAVPNPCDYFYITNAAKATNDWNNRATRKVNAVDMSNITMSSDGIHQTWLGAVSKAQNDLQALINAGRVPGSATVYPPATPTYTTFNGTSNYLRFGNILGSFFSSSTDPFKMRITLDNTNGSLEAPTTRMLLSKWDGAGNQRSFYWYLNGQDMLMAIFPTLGTGANSRVCIWSGAVKRGQHSYEIAYDPSTNGNNGLSRFALAIDGGAPVFRFYAATAGALGTIFNGTAELAFGVTVNAASAPSSAFWFDGKAKDLQVENSAGGLELSVPILSNGLDVSGNGRNGTFV